MGRYSSYSRDTERDNDRYSSSRYSTVTSPTSTRRPTTSYSSSTYSRYLPSSRWTPRHYSDEEAEEERDSDNIRDRDGRRARRGETDRGEKGEV